MKRWGDFVETGFQIINAIKSNNTCEQICELNESGILEKIIPEVKSMKEVGQCKYHKVDCFSHTIYALEEFEKLLVEDNFPNHLKKEIWKYLKSEYLSFCFILLIAVFFRLLFVYAFRFPLCDLL